MKKPSLKINTVKFKISVLYTAILGFILLIFTGAVYFSVSYTLYDDLDTELSAKAAAVASAVNGYLDVLGDDDASFRCAVNRIVLSEGEHPDLDKISTLENQWTRQVEKRDLYDDFIAIIDTRGQPLVCSANVPDDLLDLFLKRLPKRGDGKPLIRNISFKKNVVRLIAFPAGYKSRRNYSILIGTSLKPALRTLRKQEPVVVLVMVIILVLSVFIGRFLANRILKPVQEIALTASAISSENLTARVRTAHADEEMKALTGAFNEMIERLEKAFAHISEFSSNVSHELKTPLAIIRGQCEVALRQDGSEEKYRQVIRDNIEQVKRMLKIINDLFLLARLDFRPELFTFEEISFNQFMTEIHEQSKLLAEEKHIAVTLEMPEENLNVKADTVHLRRLFMNIIDNAVKFTPEGGAITLTMKEKGIAAQISIADTGCGIEKKDLPRIFDRFFHKHQPGREVLAGEGLGLSLALAIARLHDGDITVTSTPGKGSAFTVTIPLA